MMLQYSFSILGKKYANYATVILVLFVLLKWLLIICFSKMFVTFEVKKL